MNKNKQHTEVEESTGTGSASGSYVGKGFLDLNRKPNAYQVLQLKEEELSSDDMKKRIDDQIKITLDQIKIMDKKKIMLNNKVRELNKKKSEVDVKMRKKQEMMKKKESDMIDGSEDLNENYTKDEKYSMAKKVIDTIRLNGFSMDKVETTKKAFEGAGLIITHDSLNYFGVVFIIGKYNMEISITESMPYEKASKLKSIFEIYKYVKYETKMGYETSDIKKGLDYIFDTIGFLSNITKDKTMKRVGKTGDRDVDYMGMNETTTSGSIAGVSGTFAYDNPNFMPGLKDGSNRKIKTSVKLPKGTGGFNKPIGFEEWETVKVKDECSKYPYCDQGPSAISVKENSNNMRNITEETKHEGLKAAEKAKKESGEFNKEHEKLMKTKFELKDVFDKDFEPKKYSGELNSQEHNSNKGMEDLEYEIADEKEFEAFSKKQEENLGDSKEDVLKAAKARKKKEDAYNDNQEVSRKGGANIPNLETKGKTIFKEHVLLDREEQLDELLEESLKVDGFEFTVVDKANIYECVWVGDNNGYAKLVSESSKNDSSKKLMESVITYKSKKLGETNDYKFEKNKFMDIINKTRKLD